MEVRYLYFVLTWEFYLFINFFLNLNKRQISRHEVNNTYAISEHGRIYYTGSEVHFVTLCTTDNIIFVVLY